MLHLCFQSSQTDRVKPMNWQDGPRLLPSASLGRRVIALLIDWTMSRLIASLIGPYLAIQTDFNTLLIFYFEVTVLTILFQSSAGQRIMAIKVVSYPEQLRVPAKKIALRTLLICLVIPAVFTKDGRSVHDLLTNTQTVRELY